MHPLRFVKLSIEDFKYSFSKCFLLLYHEMKNMILTTSNDFKEPDKSSLRIGY